jgi:hypothetical protein
MRTLFAALVVAALSPVASQAATVADAVGTIVSQTAQAGTYGVDFSANKPALPGVGATFAASGPYASYVLIASAPANASRIAIEVENNSGAQIAIEIDDGTALNGATPNNASVFALAGGAGVGTQGGSWGSLVEKGRVQVYAPSASAQVAIRQN